jgi:hypothetical protein
VYGALKTAYSSGFTLNNLDAEVALGARRYFRLFVQDVESAGKTYVQIPPERILKMEVCKG